MGFAFAPFSRTHQGDFVGASCLTVGHLEPEKHVKCPGVGGGGGVARYGQDWNWQTHYIVLITVFWFFGGIVHQIKETYF